MKTSDEKPKDDFNSFMLPKSCYGPICLKILDEFIEHHHLPKDVARPNTADLVHCALSKIFNIMALSMGPEKRQEVLKDLQEYSMTLPAYIRG